MSKSPANNKSEPISATLWLADIEAFNNESILAFLNRLSRDEADRYSSFLRKERQRQYLLGRVMLKSSIAEVLGLPLNEISVVERYGNAPLLKFKNSITGKEGDVPYFSISHSGRWVGCVISSQTPLGLDIEVKKPKRNFMEIAKAMFCRDECDLLLKHAEIDWQDAFYGIWTKKEAMFKLISSLESPSAFATMRDVNALNTSASSLHFNTMRYGDVFFALCSRDALQEIRLAPFGISDIHAADLLRRSADWL